MNEILAVDENYAIGYKGDLLEFIPEDLKFFKEMTLNKVVVMGRKTFESLPGQKPLKNRINIILTTNCDYKVDGAEVVYSKEELFEKLKKYNSSDIYIIGGASLYIDMLDVVDTIYLTKIYKKHTADTYYINIDKDDRFYCDVCGDMKEYNGIKFNFNVYKKR